MIPIQQIVQNIMMNSQMVQNPMIKDAINMAQNGNEKEIEEFARNVCREKGLNPDELYEQVRKKYGL